ncbi:MAG: DUF3300 domain-containing protein [Paraburkholderia sp.]|jgi:hypothetical protein|nr:DUF3300 domain-containing protein [Paraburkholderia sp.]
MCAALAAAPLFVGPTGPAAAIAQSAPGAAHLSNQQLDSLTAPIALYPDALLAQVLMAATFPADVQAAAAWSKANPNLKGDDAVKAVSSQPWDPSVQSLVAFPQVLATMDSKPDWVQQIGSAFLAQPNDVMDSVQRLRLQAQKAGNLKTTEQQKVIVQPATGTSTTQTIVIEPANPQVVYVPTYNPTVVYGAWPYPAYPPVYMPPPPGYAIATGFVSGLAFGAGIAVANSLWGGFGWGSHDVNINVNRYNNINVNHRIDTNHSTANWNRNANVERRNQNFNRGNQNLNRGNLNGQHNQFRGYDQSRSQAMQTLQNRTGQNMSGNASQRLQGIQQGGRPNGNGNLSGATRNANHGNLSGATQNANRGNLSGATHNANRPADLGNRAQNANRSNALRGAGDGNAARADMQRGQQSRAAFQSRGGSGFSGGGGAHPSFGGGGGGRMGGGGGHFGRR